MAEHLWWDLLYLNLVLGAFQCALFWEHFVNCAILGIPLTLYLKYLMMQYMGTRWLLLARWLTSARAYRIGGRKLCPSVCLYVKRYLLLQFCTDYNQTWINMIWAVAAKTLLSQIFHNWRRIEVNCVYISHCKWYRTSAGMPACIPNRRCCAGQCAGQ